MYCHYRRNADESLRRLERSLSDDPSALPQYAWNYLRIHGQPSPVAVPEILYFCETHRHQCGPGTNRHLTCPQTVWQSGPPPELGSYIASDLPCQVVMGLNIENWINWIPHQNNLFQVKKQYFPEPTTPELLLAQFKILHHDHPAFILLGEQVMSYMSHQLSTAIEIIAALHILPPVENRYYLTINDVFSWDEIVKITNLKTDLIRGYPEGTLTDHPPRERMYSRSLGFCIENMSPTSILTFGVVLGSPWRATDDPGARRQLYRSNLQGGITMVTRCYGENKDLLKPLPVELNWFG